MSLALVVLLGVATISAQSTSVDWPQWRGPDRTGVSKETGLLAQWPRSGPSVVWSASMLGAGFGSIAIQGDRVLVQGMRNRQSVVSSLNRADGKVTWVRPLGPAAENDRGSGPRSTPTFDGDRVYVLTENGDLACLRAADGTIVWQRNILKEFGGQNINWLVSESPLVDGNLVIVTPGGRGAGMVALDKMAGKTVWVSKELSDEAGYASPVIADVQGVRTVITMTSEAGVGVRVSDGKLMWRYGPVANRTANIATPVYSDGKVFFTSSYGTGAALLGLRASSGEVRAQEIYFTRDMKNHHGGVVLVNGHIYGYNDSILTCLEFATGKMVWRDRSVGKGAVMYADGHLYILSEDNVVGLVEATPAGYREKGRFSIADQGWPSWSHPVVSGGRLYIRNQGTLASYDVRAKQ
ncbi:MAG TPA: PQQ-binding-like beta-propeller repeat protein [Vicinamibacterales bacterium]|nr:PQQ-binding-like beta-propeller repeat protein [Vicinamibacterales bacterium]